MQLLNRRFRQWVWCLYWCNVWSLDFEGYISLMERHVINLLKDLSILG